LGVVVRLSIDELKGKADEKYQPIEIDLPSGSVARYENLIRLDEVRQRAVLEHVDSKRAEAKDDEGRVEGEAFDITRLVDSTSGQIVFVKEWSRLMLGDDSISGEVEAAFGDDLGLWLYVFNTWISSEGISGEASPSAE